MKIVKFTLYNFFIFYTSSSELILLASEKELKSFGPILNKFFFCKWCTNAFYIDCILHFTSQIDYATWISQ